MSWSRRILLALGLLTGCGGQTVQKAPNPVTSLDEVRITAGHPPLALVSRDGDPAAAFAVHVFTEGVDPERDPEVAVALGGTVEARLHVAGIQATITPSWDGYRFSGLLVSEREAALAPKTIASALLSPITADDLAAAQRRLLALAKRPLREAALRAVARCTAEPFAVSTDPAPLTVERLESWRASAHGVGRVAVSLVGVNASQSPFVSAHATTRGFPSTPRGRATPPGPGPRFDGYDSSGSSTTRTALVQFSVPTKLAVEAVATATRLGIESGALDARLRASDPASRVRSVVGVAKMRGGCLTVSIDVGELSNESAPRIARVIAVTRHEIDVALLAEGTANSIRTIVRQAGDPREAAERAARWVLSEPEETPEPTRVAVGVSLYRDAPTPTDASRASALLLDIGRALEQTKAASVEFVSRVEPGQGESWILIGAPAGDDDSGLNSAAVATLVRDGKALAATGDVTAEPWVARDAAGILIRGTQHEGETPSAFASRLANAAGAIWFGVPVSSKTSSVVRTELWRRADASKERALSIIGSRLFPGRPGLLTPGGSAESISKLSDSAIEVRVQSFRKSATRVAFLSNVAPGETATARHAIERWALPTAGAVTFPTASLPGVPSTGIVRFDSKEPEAWLAFPLSDSPLTRDSARTLAALLDGEGGLLERALSGTVRSSETRVIGGRALVIHLTAPDAALDSAVTRVRSLLQQLREAGIKEADLQRASASFVSRRMGRQLDPRERLGALFLGVDTIRPPPSASDVAALLTRELRDDALLVVVTRPPAKP